MDIDKDKSYTFGCPHCKKIQTKTEFEILGHEAMMSMMPGPRLLSPEGTYPCEHCKKAISIAEIMAGKHAAQTRGQACFAMLVVAVIIAAACYFLFN